MTAVTARMDERLRLAGCLLAAGDWPEWEQAQKPYRPHRVAEGTRRSLANHRRHPAVIWAQTLAADTERGGPSKLFAHALVGDWPDKAAGAIADFAVADPQTHWMLPGPDWQVAVDDLTSLLAAAGLGEFLADLFGELPVALAVYPNLLYPGRQAVAVSGRGELVLCQPPPPAWGASTPWRFAERPDEVLASLAEGFSLGLLAIQPEVVLGPRAVAGLGVAAAVLYLRRAQGAAAADQYMLMEQRMRGLPRLPLLVGALEGCHSLAEVARAINSIEP